MNTATKLLLLLSISIWSLSLFAGTNSLAAEITYSFTGANTISARITSYTIKRMIPADRDSLYISWGDGTVEVLARSYMDSLSDGAQLNIYPGSHTYTSIPSVGFVIISTADPDRNAGIINISNSINVPFYIEDTIWFAAQGHNNAGPVLLYPPIDYAFVGDTFFHNPAAYDVEADSLTFELVTPLQAPGTVVPGYVLPTLVPSPSANNTISIDRLTGEIIWATPQEAGLYDIAILVHEYRYGQLLSTTTRDMIISVLLDTVAAPRLSGVFADTVIAPGTELSLPYGGVADAAYTDSLTVFSGIFDIAGSNAALTTVAAAPAASGTLTWTPGHNQYKPRETRIVAVRSLQESTDLHTNIRAYRVTVADPSFTTGVADVAYPQDVTVYPIPASHKLYGSTSLPSGGTSIVDMIGRERAARVSGQEVDISDLPAGIYLLRWQNEGKTFVRRFIKE